MVTQTQRTMVRSGYKHSDVGIIPEDWKKIKIGEHFDFKNGLNKAKEFFGKGTPIINYMDVYPHLAIYAKNIHGKVTVSNDELRAFEVRKGDVLFTRTSETIEEIGLSSAVMDDVEKTVFSGFLLRGRPKTKLFESQFKKYCFRSTAVRKQVISTSSQTTRALTNGRFLSNVSILVPINPKEQFKIAESLSNIDELINHLELLIRKKKNIKQGATQEFLTRKKKIEGFEGDWKFKDFPLVCWFQEGPGLRNWQFTKEGMKVINVTNLENGYLNLKRTDRHISMDEFNKIYKHFEIDDKDIVVASSGNSYAKVAVVRKKDLPLMMNTSVIRFKPLNGLDYNFLLEFLKSSQFKDQIDFLITGGAQPNFGPAHLQQIKIKLPTTKNEQSVIGQILKDMDSEIKELEKKRDKYIMIKKGMMQKLLTGEIRLK